MASKNLVTANVVVGASAFNVSVFSQFWLVKHGIYAENEFTPGEYVSLPVLSQIGTPACDLLIVPERLQFTLKNPSSNSKDLDKVTKIVRMLPETPYTALGMNIVWNITPSEGEDIGAFTKAKFAVPTEPLKRFFDTADARFGAYMSKNYDVFRLKLDIKPVLAPTPISRIETVMLNFNFHLDVASSSNKAEDVCSALTKWNAVFSESENITNLLM